VLITVPSQVIIICSQVNAKPPPEGREGNHFYTMNKINMDLGDKKPVPMNLQQLCEHWFMVYADIMNGAPKKFLLLREINH
jgi:hypothetical protein